MHRAMLTFLSVLLVAGVVCAKPPDVSKFSDERVQRSIERAREWLWRQQRPDGSWEGFNASWGNWPGGPTALVLFALLESGENPQDPRMTRALDWLSIQPATKTYSLGLRCNVWALANRQTGGKYMEMLKQDVRQLVTSTKDGSYGYDAFGGGQSSGDNSNSQYGVLGVWAGALANVEIPSEYWQLVATHWSTAQKGNGGWTYNKNDKDASATMTGAGVASLYVCMDNLHLERFMRCNTGIRPKRIDAGLEWLSKHFEKTLDGKLLGHGDLYYHLFGVERVGLASGRKYFGTADWYKMGAVELLDKQKKDGSWSGKWDPLVSTSYALLFLVRGQKPVLMNKLHYDGDWNNRPRDLAVLSRWMTEKFERSVYWQTINLEVPVSEWHDAPMLYVSGSRAPEFSDAEIAKLRDYVLQGGVLFSAAECNGRQYMAGMRHTVQEMFPDHPLEVCKPEHEIYSAYFPLRGRPRFFVSSNGVRPLVIHTDEDLPLAWQVRRFATQRWAFEGAANVAMYVTDKGIFRHRGVSHWPDEPGKYEPRRTVTLARVSFKGNSDPEPLAYERFARRMANRHQVRVKVLGPMPAAKLPGSGAQVASLTGTGRFTLSEADQQALKKWIAGGGTLVVDAAGGDKEFAESAEQLLAAMYGVRAIQRLSPTSGVYRLEEMAIEEVDYRRRTRVRLGETDRANLRTVLVEDRPAVIYSPEDISAGLLGVPAYTIDGYAPESAWRLMRNIVLWASGGPLKGPEEEKEK
jgi:hypothetical protein